MMMNFTNWWGNVPTGTLIRTDNLKLSDSQEDLAYDRMPLMTSRLEGVKDSGVSFFRITGEVLDVDMTKMRLMLMDTNGETIWLALPQAAQGLKIDVAQRYNVFCSVGWGKTSDPVSHILVSVNNSNTPADAIHPMAIKLFMRFLKTGQSTQHYAPFLLQDTVQLAYFPAPAHGTRGMWRCIQSVRTLFTALTNNSEQVRHVLGGARGAGIAATFPIEQYQLFQSLDWLPPLYPYTPLPVSQWRMN